LDQVEVALKLVFDVFEHFKLTIERFNLFEKLLLDLVFLSLQLDPLDLPELILKS